MQKGVIRKRRPSPLSEYGKQLKEKQELKGQYNLREKQFRQYVKDTLAKSGSGDAEEMLMRSLEKRLDNVVFRMGMAETRRQARQMVVHRHFRVNGRVVNIPSFKIKAGDKVSLHDRAHKKTLFQNIKLALKKYEAPSWIELNKENMEGEIKGDPGMEEIGATVQIPLVFEFYSR